MGRLIDVSPSKESYAGYGKKKGTAILKRRSGAIEYYRGGRKVAQEVGGEFRSFERSTRLYTGRGRSIHVSRSREGITLSPSAQLRLREQLSLAKRVKLKGLQIEGQAKTQRLLSHRIKIKSSARTKPFEAGDKPVELFRDPRFTDVRRVTNVKNPYLTGIMHIPISKGVAAKIGREVRADKYTSGTIITEVAKPKTVMGRLRGKVGVTERRFLTKAEAEPKISIKRDVLKGLAVLTSATKPIVDVGVLAENLIRDPKATGKNFYAGLATIAKNPRYYGARFGEDLRDRPTDIIGQIVGLAILTKGLGKMSRVISGKLVKTVSVRLGEMRYIPSKKGWFASSTIKTRVGKKTITSRSYALIRVKKNGKLSISASKGLINIKVRKNLEKILNSQGIGFEVMRAGKRSRIVAVGKLIKKGAIKKGLLSKPTFKKALIKSEVYARSNIISTKLKKNLLGDIAGTKALKATKIKVFKNGAYVLFKKGFPSMKITPLINRLKRLGFSTRVVRSTQWKKLSSTLSRLRKNKKKYRGYKTIQLDSSIGLTKIVRTKPKVLTVIRKVKRKTIKIKALPKAKGVKFITVKRMVRGKIIPQRMIAKIKSVKKLSPSTRRQIRAITANQSELIKAWIKSGQLTKAEILRLIQAGVISSAVYSKISARAKQAQRARVQVKPRVSMRQLSKQLSRQRQRIKATTSQVQKQKQRQKLRGMLRLKQSLTAVHPPVAISMPIIPKPIVPIVPLIPLPRKIRTQLQRGRRVKLTKRSLAYIPSLRGMYHYTSRGRKISKAKALRLIKKGLTGLEVRYVVAKARKRARVKRKLTSTQRRILVARLRKARASRMRNLKRRR